MTILWRTGFEVTDVLPWFMSSPSTCSIATYTNQATCEANGGIWIEGNTAELVTSPVMTGSKCIHFRKGSVANQNYDGPGLAQGGLGSTGLFSLRFQVLIPSFPPSNPYEQYISLLQIWYQHDSPYIYNQLAKLYLVWSAPDQQVSFSLRSYSPVDESIPIPAPQITANTIHTVEIDITQGATGKMELYIDNQLVGAIGPRDYSNYPPNAIGVGIIDSHMSGLDVYIDEIEQGDAYLGAATVMHRLSLLSSPQPYCLIRVDGVLYTTNIGADLPEGVHTLEAPASYSYNGIWNFSHWEDNSTNLTRAITLSADTAITAYYVLSPTPPTAHILNVGSSISNTPFTVTGGTQMSNVTPWSGTLDEGAYVILMPATALVSGQTYAFQQWDDGTTNPARTINLTQDTTIQATYVPVAVDTAVVSGTITAAGAPVVGATVQAETYTAETDSSGQYSLIVPVGTYAVTVSKAGYISQTVTVTASQTGTYTLDFTIAASPTPERNNAVPLILIAVVAALALS